MIEEIEGLSLEMPEPGEAPPPEPAAPLVLPDAELAADNSVVEVTGQKIDVGPLLAAERKRVREATEKATEKRVREEYEPLQRQANTASQLQARLDALEAKMAPPKVEATEPEVSDAEAETYARRHQLYDSESKLDVKSAKSILAEHRAELRKVSRETTEEVLKPMRGSEEKRAAHDNFMRIAATKDADGEYVFKDAATHKYLLDAWNALPDNLRSVPEVGEVVVKTALGEMALHGKRKSAAPPKVELEPLVSESAGTRGALPYTMSGFEKKLATEANMPHKDFEARAKLYQPGQPNSLED